MNFLKSILSDDPHPIQPQINHSIKPNSPLKQPADANNSINSADDGWGFGALFKTFATRSESVIETYRRDLMEFGSGLRKESVIIREVATRAVKSTAEIISKERLNFDPETPNGSLIYGRHSRLESQLSAIRSDLNTFCEEPEDVEEYENWKLGFRLEERRGEIEDNGSLGGVYKRVVPGAVDSETFWCRYFYRVDKLMQQEKVRVDLVRRAVSIDDEEEELSWDVDDEDERGSGDTSGVELQGGDGIGHNVDGSGCLSPVEKKEDPDKNSVVDLVSSTGGDGPFSKKELKLEEARGMENDEEEKSEESFKAKMSVEEKSEYHKKDDASGMLEEIGWDEIEDIGSDDEAKVSASTQSEARDDLKKRLNAAEDDEDLNWDSEDDDEPAVKA